MTMRIEMLDDITEVFPLLIFQRNPYFQKDFAFSKIGVVTFYPPKRKFCPQNFSYLRINAGNQLSFYLPVLKCALLLLLVPKLL